MYDESAIFVQMPVVVKARQEGNRRLVELEASNEAVDSEGDVILQSALLDSADAFVKSGHLDIDHLSEIGDRLGVLRPADFIVGNPIEVKDLGGGRTGVLGELHKSGRRKADELWESLKADPPVRWQASIYGFPQPGQMIDCRVSKAENTYGATRFLVKGLDWRSLAFTRNPINTSIKGCAQVVTAKSFLAVMKSRMPEFGGNGSAGIASPLIETPDFIMSPRNSDEMAGHFLYHIAKGNCPCVSNSAGYSIGRFQKHFEICCGESPANANLQAELMMDSLRKDRRVSFYPFSKSTLDVTGGSQSTMPPSTMRQVRVMNDASLFEKFAAFLKGQAHGGVPGSDKLEGIKTVEDIFNESNGEHSVPSRSEIVTGAPEASSGGGAVRMVARYSDPSAQAGLTAQYERFDNIMREFGKSQDAMAHRLSKSERALSALITLVGEIGKAQQAATVKSVTTDDTFLGKAEEKIAKARKALRKAEMEEDDKEREERKSDLTAILDTLKSAVRLLSKAEDEEGTDDEKMEKATKTLQTLKSQVVKSLAEITKAEEDEAKEKEEREAAEKAKRDEAAAKAGDAGTVVVPAAKAEDTAEEKKDDTAKAVTPEMLQKAMEEAAMKGEALFRSSVQEMMNTVLGASRTGVAPPPAFIKADTATSVVSIQDRLDAARDSGILSDGEGIIAQSLMQRQALAQAGRIPSEQVARDIAAAPAAVRELFQAAA